MKATLREKPISGGRKSLYIDYYPAIPHPVTDKPTRREFLSLYIFHKPRTDLEREHNKETKLLGKNICARRQLEIQGGHFGFLVKKSEDADFLAYFHRIAKDYLERGQAEDSQSKNNWMTVYGHLEKYSNGRAMASDIDADFIDGFRAYLVKARSLRKGKKKLAFNSAVNYFTIFMTGIRRAYDEKLIAVSPADGIERLQRKESQREFLTKDELQAMAKAECEWDFLKRASLFSALTGLRYSDIAKLTWGEVYGDKGDHYLRYRQKKTSSVETLPISASAYQMLGERKAPNVVVFPELLYSSWQNQKLQEWANRAGIIRKITFHTFRHTYATLQLTLGTDIYTVSKMLGHRDLKTTQIYAKIVDQKKREAADKITIEL
ncbi:site-specific integrase [Larkinella ripae]